MDEVSFTWKHRDRGSWDDRLAEIVAFKEKYGHCNIPIRIGDPPKLAGFINATRTQRNKGVLSAERIAKLNAVGFMWSTETTIDEDGTSPAWKVRYEELLKFREEFGNCDVQRRFIGNPSLGVWVNNQRSLKKRGKLTLERERLLNEIGFIWEKLKRKIS